MVSPSTAPIRRALACHTLMDPIGLGFEHVPAELSQAEVHDRRTLPYVLAGKAQGKAQAGPRGRLRAP